MSAIFKQLYIVQRYWTGEEFSLSVLFHFVLCNFVLICIMTVVRPPYVAEIKYKTNVFMI